MRRRSTKPKAKKVSYELIPRDSAIGERIYPMLEEIIAAHHDHLVDARIALAWATAWKADADGIITLGKCKKASDLDRELMAFDFVILLNRGFWYDLRVKDHQRRALLDHELCHASVKYDEAGDVAVDERGRTVYRIRKHDIEEFSAIVERHGTYKADLERFAQALRRSGVPAFQPCEACTETPGWVYIEDLTGTKRTTRCKCFVTWRDSIDAQGAPAPAVTH